MVFYMFYNGYNVEKRFSKEYLNFIFRDYIARYHDNNVLWPDFKPNIDWNGSTRKQLCVLNKKVYSKLLQCSNKYFWPNGEKFICRQYKNYQQRRHQLQNYDDYRQHHSYDHAKKFKSKVYRVTSSATAAANAEYYNYFTSAADAANNNDDYKRPISPTASPARSISPASSVASTLKFSSSPTPNTDNWELELYARTNGYDHEHEDQETCHLEEGEINEK
ncbi:Late expression factor 6 [Lonomia obliqua multiple nucleopolyhedrovirus]|uniref:Late expression factor 6 n=1 Tax=Lonomia obliqua multiple nucleopolyhedrovirus TaxID=134394 RepID=A0A126FCD6_9ABAC|nr:Late expression factor 6 [Lonomia obliqua multiple nucleopolyhedrovirus]AKN81070.1 Late expression factor 6 [Lonomia obliqua multiple nucleopolyhedrovirus]